MKPQFLLKLFCLIGFPTLLFGQKQDIQFIRLGVEKGLSQSFVSSLMKDQSGHVWVGTQDGLNRFDGYSFDAFFNDPSDSSSLSSNYILDILQDKEGGIWIGTNEKGLCRFSKEWNTFKSFRIKSKNIGANSIRCMAEIGNEHLLLGTDLGLYVFNKANGTTTRPNLVNFDYEKSIYSFCPLNDAEILIGGLEVVLLFDIPKNEVRKINIPMPIAGSIHALLPGINNDLWMGTGKGLFHFIWNGQKDNLILKNHYLPDSSDPSSINSSYISTLYLDALDGLWIGTNKGLNYLNLTIQSEGFSHFTYNPQEEYSISDNLIYDLLEVESGIIWAATQDGISQFSYLPPTIHSTSLQEQLNCGKSVHGLIKDNEQFLMCTDKGLLLYSSLSGEETSCITKTEFPEMEDEFLVSITQADTNSYWIALRRGGFAKFSNSNIDSSWESFKLPAGKYSSIGTNYILETTDSTLWIGSSGLGLWSYNQKKETYASFTKSESDSNAISGNYIFYLYQASDDFLWVATADGGLCRLDTKTNKFKCYTHNVGDPQSLSSNMVLSVFEDTDHRIWACTSNGLCLLNKEGTWDCYYKKDGLPNNVIYGLLQDAAENFWVSTGGGLARFKLENRSLDVEVFTTSDGLLNNEFNQHAFYKTDQGKLIFGTRGGFNYFDADKIIKYNKTPDLVLTDFKLFNESVPIIPEGRKKVFHLTKHINTTERIVLPYNKNFIAFEFAGINFHQANQNQYAYQLEGLDEDWVYSENRRFANYPGLKAGSYTFKVKAANHDGVWNEAPKKVNVIVKNAPWKTWWAYLLYVLGIIGLVYGIFRYRIYTIRQIERTKQEERHHFRKRSARDFHDEAGNQITRISLMTEMAKRQTGDNEKLNNLIHSIGENIQILRSGMRDFIWVLDPENDNLYQTLQRLVEFANDIFEYSPVKFSSSEIAKNLMPLKLNGNQRRHLLMFMKEAINNCLKYSKAQNAILSVQQSDDTIRIYFEDDGIGFDFENGIKGNGLKNMESRAKKLNAKHFIKSNLGKGTSVELILNITQMGD